MAPGAEEEGTGFDAEGAVVVAVADSMDLDIPCKTDQDDHDEFAAAEAVDELPEAEE